MSIHPLQTPKREVHYAATVSSIASIIALITSVYTLGVLVRPNLKPREKLGASIIATHFERKVVYDDFVKLSNVTPLPRYKGKKGTVVYVEVDLQGFEKKTYGTWLTLVNVKTDLSVPFYTYHTANYSPAAAADKAVLMGWLGDPPKGRYRLIIRLRDEGLKSAAPSNFEYEPSGGLLDVAETKEFAMA